MVGLETLAQLVKRWLWDSQARVVIGVALSLILGWLSVRGMDWGLMVDQFHSFPVGWAVASLFLLILASFLRAYRWQRLFVQQRPSLMRLFMVQNAGIGLNNVVPVRIVGEGVQFALLTMRYGVKKGVAIATLGVERVLDMVVTAVLLMAGLTLLPNVGDFLPYVVGAFVVALLSVLAIPLFIWVGSKPILRTIPVLASTVDFLLDLVKAKAALSYALGLTLVHWLVIGLCAWVLSHGMGLGISPFVATLTILGTLYFTTALPALPAAAGTFEFAVVYVLKFFDVSQALAFSYGLVIHAVLFLPPIIIAMVMFFSIGINPLKKGHAPEPMDKRGTILIDNQGSGAH